jgi:hypothetical protein
MDIFPKSLWGEREKARSKKKHLKIASGPYLSIQCGECGAINSPDRKECWKCHARFDILEYIPGERHGDLMALYEVFMVYGEDRDNPEVQHKFVVADDSKQAELKSGLVADPAWDFDYVTMFSRPICEVNVKEKPLEVANVEKKKRTT